MIFENFSMPFWTPPSTTSTVKRRKIANVTIGIHVSALYAMKYPSAAA